MRQQLKIGRQPRKPMPLLLILLWGCVVFGLLDGLPLQWASWLAFVALLIAPGYLLGDWLAHKLSLDVAERMAAALPLGMAVMALPGVVALVNHWTLSQLTLAWKLVSALVIVGWLVWQWCDRPTVESVERWRIDEIVWVALFAIGFAIIFPTLNLYKIDGDAFAVGSFSAEAQLNQPLNETEPLFGTEIGAGVRMVFNQHLTLNYLWSALSHIDPLTLNAQAQRAMLAVWAILASYTFGKAATNSRKMGLLVATIQFVIYLAAPFFRGDNVSIFFFERINADKFMVPVTMLPVVIGFAVRYVRNGSRNAWYVAAVGAFAVSAIHPLIAAMLALAIASFGGMHWLFNRRDRVVWRRVAMLAGLCAVTMALPVVQLVLASGEAAMASSYPKSFEGWEIGDRQIHILPNIFVEGIDYFGVLPDATQWEAADAETPTNPFLTWRFDLNMERRRLILFDLNNYISDPNLVMEPPYILSILLLPFLFWGIRRNLAAQLAVSSTLAVLFVMFNPIVTPLIGSAVMPWILWRFVWILPYALIFALVLQAISRQLSAISYQRSAVSKRLIQSPISNLQSPISLQFIFALLLVLVSSTTIRANLQNLDARVAFPYSFPTPTVIFDRLANEIAPDEPVLVLAEQDMSVTLPAYVAQAHVLGHRMPTISEVYPKAMQTVALQRLIDQDRFFRLPYLTVHSAEIIRAYDAQYIIVPSGGTLDMQLRLADEWFDWLVEAQTYSLYAVSELPPSSALVLQANSRLANRDWESAETLYNRILATDPTNALALTGLAESAHAQGQLEVATDRLAQVATNTMVPAVYYRLGQWYAEMGDFERSGEAFTFASQHASHVPRYHVALGDLCLLNNDLMCAEAQFAAATSEQVWLDESVRLRSQADLWRQRGYTAQALPLYFSATQMRPSEFNLLQLGGVYLELGMIEPALELTEMLRWSNPFSAEPYLLEANLHAANGDIDNAMATFDSALRLQTLRVEDTTRTHLAIARVLINANQLELAQTHLEEAVWLNPFSADAHLLYGDWHTHQGDTVAALDAYQRAYDLDPTQTAALVAISANLRQVDRHPTEIIGLLEDALDVQANDSTLLITLGELLDQVGNSVAAIDAYQTALNHLDPYNIDGRTNLQPLADSRAFAFARLAALYEDQGTMTPALNYYRAATTLAPDDSWTHMLLGDALRQRTRFAEAEAAYLAAIDTEPTAIDPYLRLVDLYVVLGDEDQAEEVRQMVAQLLSSSSAPPALVEIGVASATATPTFSDEQVEWENGEADTTQTAKILAPVTAQVANETDLPLFDYYRNQIANGTSEGWLPIQLARPHKALGDLYLGREQYTLALQAYQQAIALDKWWPAARLGLADAQLALGNTEAALATLQEAVGIAPGSAETQVALANALEQAGRETEALAIFVATNKAHPGNERAAVALARAWQSRNRFVQAEKAYQKTLAMYPGSADSYLGLAEVALARKDFDTANAMLDEARAIDPDNLAVFIRYGDVALAQGDSAGALLWYQRAVDLPASRNQISLTLIDALTNLGDATRAQAYTSWAVTERTTDVELWLRLGRLELHFGRFDSATAALTQAEKIAPHNVRVLLAWADLHQKQGDLSSAVKALERVVALQPTNPDQYITLSQLHLLANRADSAILLLTRGIEVADQSDMLYAQLAAVYLHQNQPEQALATLQAGTQKWGETPTLLLALGNYYTSRANYEQVEQNYAQALHRRPNSAPMRQTIGNYYIVRGNWAEATALYGEAVALEPTNATYLLSLGNAHLQAGQFDEADTLFRQTLALDPTSIDGYLNLGLRFEAQERWTEAIAIYQDGLTLVPTAESLLTGMARVYANIGDGEQALAWLSEANRLSPTATMHLARFPIYLLLEDTAQAEAELHHAIELQPGLVTAYIALGDFYLGNGDLVSAEKTFLQATKAVPGNPTAYLRLSNIAQQQGDIVNTRAYNDLARQIQPSIQP